MNTIIGWVFIFTLGVFLATRETEWMETTGKWLVWICIIYFVGSLIGLGGGGGDYEPTRGRP